MLLAVGISWYPVPEKIYMYKNNIIDKFYLQTLSFKNQEMYYGCFDGHRGHIMKYASSGSVRGRRKIPGEIMEH